MEVTSVFHQFILIAIGIAAVAITYIFTSSKKKSTKKVLSAPKKEALKIRNDITSQEVLLHNQRLDCWIIVDNKVYDVTEYIDEHPGGDSILNNAGKDSSVGVHGPQHPASMWDVLKLFYIGELQLK